MFFDPLPFLSRYIFLVKILLFVTSNSDNDLDPDLNGSGLVWLPVSESRSG
jgi:hypothetical protein